MSEKIYALLLRLYPPAFRKRYEEETIQLLRDRLRDEPGYVHRLRLGFDLITDIIRSLPQAYSNSYADVRGTSPIAQQLPSVPMFQSLNNQPIRRGTFALAGALTLTLIIAFGYVMELPVPSPTYGSIGSKSPVESVLERLNRQAPLKSMGKVTTEVPHPQSAERGGTNRLMASARDSALPHDGSATSKTGGQILEPEKPIPNAMPIDPALSGFVSTPRSKMAAPQTIPQRQTGTTPGGVPTTVSSRPSVFIAPPAGISGRWIEYSVAGADSRFPGGLNLIQRDSVLGGFGGLDPNHQYPVIHGSVIGNSVKLELSDGRKSFLYNLRLEGEELRGTLVIRSGSETQRTTIRLRRVQ